MEQPRWFLQYIYIKKYKWLFTRIPPKLGSCWRWRPAGDYFHQPALGETHDYRNYNL